MCRTSPEHTTRHNGGQGGPEEVRWSDDGSSEGGLSPSSGVTATDCNAVLRSESDNFLTYLDLRRVSPTRGLGDRLGTKYRSSPRAHHGQDTTIPAIEHCDTSEDLIHATARESETLTPEND